VTLVILSFKSNGSFIATAHAPDAGINTLAGYAAFGGFYYIVTAVLLSRTMKS